MGLLLLLLLRAAAACVLLQQLLLPAAAKTPPSLIPISKIEPLRADGAVGSALGSSHASGRRKKHESRFPQTPAAAATAAATLQSQIAAIAAQVPMAWASRWRPLVMAAAKRTKAQREMAYREVGGQIDSFLQRQLESLGLLQYTAAQRAVFSIASLLKDAAIIILSLHKTPSSQSLFQRPTPLPSPTLYDDPHAPATAAKQQQRHYQLQRLLLPSLGMQLKGLAQQEPGQQISVSLQQQQQEQQEQQQQNSKRGWNAMLDSALQAVADTVQPSNLSSLLYMQDDE